jgi:hypothetical protein
MWRDLQFFCCRHTWLQPPPPPLTIYHSIFLPSLLVFILSLNSRCSLPLQTDGRGEGRRQQKQRGHLRIYSLNVNWTHLLVYTPPPPSRGEPGVAIFLTFSLETQHACGGRYVTLFSRGWPNWGLAGPLFNPDHACCCRYVTLFSTGWPNLGLAGPFLTLIPTGNTNCPTACATENVFQKNF